MFEYDVQRHNLDFFWHKVRFNSSTLEISCTCKLILSVGFLCAHCLRIYSIHNVQSIPDHYFLDRWKKDANASCVAGSAGRVSESETELSRYCVWRMSMFSDFTELVSAARGSGRVRELLELSLKNTRKVYEAEISTRDACSGKRDIGDPVLYRDLGERNVRRKSVIEKVYKKSAAANGITKRSSTKSTRERMYEHMESEYPSHSGKHVHPG